MRGILVVTVFFVLSLFLGYAFGSLYEKRASELVNETFSSFKFVKEWESYKIFLFILANNATKAFAAMILGLFFGIIPILFVVLNGFLIGCVVSVFGKDMGFSIVLALLPHGILEIPAVLISCAYGFELGILFYRKLRNSYADLNYAVIRSIKKFLKIPLPMLIVAAFVETYITPLILPLIR